MICDVFNHFLENAPYDPSVLRMVNPWIPDLAQIFSVKLEEGMYWIFTSTSTRRELDAWLEERGLSVYSAELLPRDAPRYGGPTAGDAFELGREVRRKDG